MDEALHVFMHMPARDVVSWNVLIAAFVSQGRYDDAQSYFISMQENGILPDSVTCVSMLSAYTNQDAVEDGMIMHATILVSGFDVDSVIQNALINMYGRCGCLEATMSIFRGLTQDDIIAWNALISIYSFNGLEDLAQHLYSELHMKAVVPNRVTYIGILSVFSNKGFMIEGKWIHAVIVGSSVEDDVVVGTALMNLYGKGGSVQLANDVFCRMSKPNAVSWNALIAVHTQSGASKMALQLFYEMHKENVTPSRLTFVNILDACSSRSALKEGKWLHVHIKGSELEEDLLIGNTLMTMYGKCHSINNARELFDSMTQRSDVAWNVMITNYARSNEGLKAFELFEQMLQEGNLPDKVMRNKDGVRRLFFTSSECVKMG